MLKEAVVKIINGQKLSFVELREVFDEILSGYVDEIEASSFLTALNSLEINEDILLASILSSRESIRLECNNFLSVNLFENISLDSDDDYIDISLAQDLICSANDLCVSKYSFGEVNKNKSFTILNNLGFNLDKKNDFTDDEFEKLNFAYMKISNSVPYCKYASNLKRKLPFKSILDYTSLLLNPLKSKNLFLGINDKNQVDLFAKTALELGNDNTIIVCGEANFPYISPNGETKIAEAWKNKIFSYIFSPSLLEMKEASFEDIKCSVEENSEILLGVMQGKIKDARYDIIILNSALSLYISKKATSIMEGLDLAKKTINNGLMYEKFLQIKEYYS